MSKISKNMLEETYKIAIKVYEKIFNKNEGAKILCEQHKMNRNTANIHIGIIGCMLKGFCYKRAMSGDATNYYLAMIKKDFEMEIFVKALTAVKHHFQYKKSPSIEKIFIYYQNGGKPYYKTIPRKQSGG